jgi:integrase
VPIPNIIAPYFDNFSGLILSAAISKGTMSAGAFINCWNSFMNALSATAGHPVNIRQHDLRHTYCTMLRDAGIDMHQAMIWMGHSDETMILRVYDHVTDKRIQASMNQLNNEVK